MRYQVRRNRNRKLEPPDSNQFILDSKLTFVPNLRKFPRGFLDISVP